ncbi:dynein heavy chain 17, axonemal [Nannospalax galili]|uniref:dynein heavy chain 17, axonemal n=1 Tax=Nannospalax galili TaxID=1026970 RepID=UPI0004ED1D1E|nr:dynein heavy chain 17, axonemal [Nannospalax galili]
MTLTQDVRVEFMEAVSSLILKFKADKWNKLVGVEENAALFTEFFEKTDVLVMVLTLNAAGMIIPCLGFPDSLKSKGVYFIKSKPERITKDDYKSQLLYGDISPTPVDQLIVVVEEVLYSLLNQTENMDGWPRVVSEDIVKQVHRLKNEMFVMGGKIKGKTLLPIPEHLESLDGTLESVERIPSLDNSLLHSIETIIIDWSHQIRDVLSKDSAQALLDGLHPLPHVEFEFWDARLMNLQYIHKQLNRPKVNRIVEILEKAKSCYWPALQNVYMNVSQGLKEANDIVLHLKPLRILMEEMEQADFTVLPTFITKVLSTICFIWATSEHYNTPSRVIVILQEFCNQIIEMTRTFLSPDEVLKGLQGEIEEVLSGISLSVGVLKELFHAYDFCCANMKLFFKDKPTVPWEFPSSLAFSRMNSFLHRVQTIEDLYKTAIEFLKLEKIELGGVHGSIHGNLVTQIYNAVFEMVKVFADCKYDPLDPGDSSFDEDYSDFETKIQDLDRRLATIFCQAFDDCTSIESSTKLLYMCGSLLERPLILVQVVPRYSVMLELFNTELDNAKLMYDAQMAASAEGNIPPIHKNMPPVAGQLKWSLEMQERLEVSMKHLKHIDHPVMSSAEAKLVYEKYDEMMELLRSRREKIYQQWVGGVDENCHFNLGQPILQRDPFSSLIQVNFSKTLVAVLREVKYLNFQQQKEIPGSAEKLFSDNETFRKFVGNLELIVGWYNEIKTTVMEVEFPLIKSELEVIDVKLLSAETTLFWNGEGVFQYIQEMREILYDLQKRIQKAKQNIEGITQVMQEWSANPLFERKDKKEALLDLDGRVANLNKRYVAVKDAGVRVQAMVAENAELFRADVTSLPWKDYVNYIDDTVLDEFNHFIRKSLNYLMDNMTMDTIAPLFEIRMELDEKGLTFNPSLEMGAEDGFLVLIEGLIDDLYNVARLIPRLAKGRLNYKVNTSMDDWKTTKWKDINVEQMDIDCKKFAKDVRSLDKEMKAWDAFVGLENTVKNMITSLRAVSELQNPAIRDRHWQQLMQATQVKFEMSDETTLADLLQLNLHKYEDEVRNIVDKAVKESGMEKVLKTLDSTWATMEFEHEPHLRTGTMMLKSDEVLVETLEDNQVQLQNLMMSKYLSHFLKEVTRWQQKLSTADSVISIWFEVQRTWSHLESIFIGSEDIRAQLPEDSKRFDAIDLEFKALMADAMRTPNVVEATNKPGLYDKLESLKKSLSVCEKALAEYLETKRLAFPRFYFISSADLLDILSNGNDPTEVSHHLSKLFDSLCKLKFRLDASGKPLKSALGMYSEEDEYVDFDKECDLSGQVEIWLNRVLDRMCATLRHEIPEAVVTYEEKPREQWIFDYPAQVALTGTQIWWTTEVGLAFARLEEGYENAIKDYNKKQISQLNALITLLIGNLSAGDRMKIMTICTIDVHARDVVAKMIIAKVESSQAFTWQSQLRHRWDEEKKHCFANICDAQIQYSYEYLGNTPRLVITPLTDRCYITLTQSLHLIMGGAPAGPAGTGKTETTKDLGRALGTMVYVFNCSEQMDHKSCGNIYKGLAQTGAWGCFDEFNRISVEVLSVIAVQVKCVQDAIRAKKKKFNFLGEMISLIPTVGLFITMNPGYAGRTELPENLKALFRPCAMVVPDFELICEIMLVAEGFLDARLLARKFITLYTLCKELLSKQDHYDWGLRAIKSVLVVAGSLKRADPTRAEDQVLMRALRDFNIPKIVTDDLPVFMGLIGDLFPALDVPRKRDLNFEKIIKQSIIELRLQAEDSFVLKVVQLEELLQVRHSVFVIGNAGSGKSQVLRSLNKTYQSLKRKPVTVDLDPKAVTCDELFGIINPATREWKDGLFSTIMRDLANITHDGPKWIVLDGDIDPMWIESLNTVMDDNKVLTLASNERIPLNRTMRLVFEISHLRTATPATVSRAGILYINPADLGWNPVVSSWIERRTVQSEKANLTILFDKYLPTCLDKLRFGFKRITPVPEITVIQTILYLLECLLTEKNAPPDSPKELYELYFVFACFWAFGGSMFQDQLIDYRVEFSKWWINEFKTIKLPSQGTIFDYYIDPESKKFLPWTDKVPAFQLDPDVPLQASLVHTTETIRIRYFMDLLMEKSWPVMLVGNAGTGKSVLMEDKLENLSTDDYLVQAIPFNFYTTSAMLQGVLEKPLEKKSGRNYGPPGTKKLIYFIDDMNMPEVDKYGTVAPHTLIRQHMDHGHWYDRQKLTLRDVHNCQYVACMNPTSGSFTIDPRLQRHFCVFAVSFPGQDALTTIYNTILAQHLSYRSAPLVIQRMSNHLVAAALALHQKITATFLPTAIKFHYVFNLRDLSNIFQGLLFSTAESLKTPLDIVRLWLHEAERVYGDKMVDEKDQETLRRLTITSTKKFFGELGEEHLFAKPNIFCHFAQGIGDPKYLAVLDVTYLNRLLVDVLDSYNEVNAVMNLVLFEDAVAHICRINRILESPRGNALLVGVGGSGKQSLSRLAAYISALDVFQITLKKGYGVVDLKVDLAAQYIKSAVKNVPSVFLMTDSQVAEEQFLVLINDLLASGEIPGLFAEDDLENIISSMRPQVKSLGMTDTREACWKFFIEKVRRQLKVILCFSPVGSVLRVRARKFPAMVNCTAIDWFHEWPEDALVSVSARFLRKTEGIQPEVKTSISLFMSYVHTTVNEMSKVYLATERRYNYTTPKTFLEQIKLYQSLLAKKRMELVAKIERLENGLMKLQSTASQVDDLKAKLAVQEAELKQKNENTDKLIQVVGVETEKVSKEKAIADEEEIKVEVINKNVTEKQKACETDLAKAEPALLAAQEALNTLNKNNLTELKSFGSPPDAVVNVTAAVMILTAPGGKIPKDKSWKAAKIMMGKVDTFLDSLRRFDKEHIPEDCLKAFKPYQGNPTFDPEFIRSKSTAAAGLCSWCINIVRFYEVYCDVAPKRQALEEANAELAEAQEKLSRIKNKIAELNANLSNLTSAFENATAEKIKCQQEADATNRVISLANRLVGGLASENVRWAESVETFRKQGVTLCGDVLLISAFVSYVGYFTKKYRTELMEKFWIPYINKLKVPIPITEGLDPLTLLTDDTDVASWNNQGLPSDRMSTENATILCNTERWPLIVDAQLQGIKWIKNKYGSDLKAIRLGQKSYLDIIERAISEGDILLIENIGETVDPVLDPLLGRNTIKKGRYIKIGDKEVEYHPKFRLILHTKYFNPHYKPEMQAQCTLINFLVTRDGLEDQLLAAVVAKERPDLEQLKASLTKSQNEFKILLKGLEDSLLARLSAASGNFLGDTALLENLETTKHTANEIEEKVQEAKITEAKINEARENYRPAAARASLLFFILSDLNKINPIYQFSLKAFSVVFEKAIQETTRAEEVKQRVINLTDEITYSVYMYTARGLFERDKLIFLAQVTFQVLSMKKELNPVELDFLLRFPFKAGVVSPVDFLQHQSWGGIKALSEMDEFKNLDNDIEGSAKRWKKLVESEAPEKEIFPKEWKNKTALQKLCMVRCMRPDRMTYAIKNFVEEKMGSKFVESRSVEFSRSYKESSPSTPIFFILSPGVDPLKDVEALGKKLGFTIDNGKLHNVSLGQGQEVVAENALDVAAEKGHWVILQNIHLVARWLSTLDKKVERYSIGSHHDYRLFISAEPAPSPESHIIPQGILENAIKITNEPPTGMYANLHKALDLFTQDTLEMCTKELEFKCILFALCYFHAVVAERCKFGAQGWNRSYPFNHGDLTISADVLYNYLEANPKVPWDDLRYLFGEIMYGGHITDDWDRRLCRTYLAEYIRVELLEGEVLLAPGFQIPPNLDYKGYHEYIDENLPPESPYLYGLHPNAEIGFLTVTSEKLFRTVLEMQPKETDSGAGTGMSREEKVKAVLDEILEKIPETFNMAEIMAKAAKKTPYVVVAFQECERMNILTNEMRRSLKELNLGLKGELTITTDMEDLSTALFYDTVPKTWVARAYPSMMGLGAWYADLLLRIRELEAWTTDFALPTTVWLAGFFNPQSFLTAIMQSMARKNEWPLDKMCLSVEVTKKNREDMTAPPREGAYVYGLFMEGARWDTQTGVIAEAKLKDLTPAMPVIFIKAIPADRVETKNIYECPVYKTRIRGPTYVWTFNLKTKEKAARWTLAAVALLLQV